MPRIKVPCSACGNDGLLRWPINTATKKPIAHFFCNAKCKGDWQRIQREQLGFTKDWLIEEYVKKGRSANDIAREIGRDSKRVWEWIRDYGIDTRDRGHNYKENLLMDGSTMLGKKHSAETREKIRLAAIADGRLPWGKGNEPYWKGKKGPMHPGYKGGMTPERQAVYSSREWVEAVKKVWHRDNATCQHCGKHHNAASNRGTFHIHHIVSFQVRELRTEVSNLVLLCKDCHKFVHSKANTGNIFIKER